MPAGGGANNGQATTRYLLIPPQEFNDLKKRIQELTNQRFC